MHVISDRVWAALACPGCGQKMQKKEAAGAKCTRCNVLYPLDGSGQLDLRLQKPKTEEVKFTLGVAALPGGFEFTPLQANAAPGLDLASLDIPWHLTKTLVSHFPKAKAADALMLDLGCGDGVHRQVVEAFGFEWVGLDYVLPEAPIRGDGHALPFESGSFEFILSIAVLEHIQFPFVMMQEAFRCLQPGGVLIGTVSFMEPFHNDSFYHHSHLATYNTLQNAGFDVSVVSPAKEWQALHAIGAMALFRMAPSWLSRLLVAPLQALHRLWWWLGYAFTRSERASERYRQLSTSGAFTFIAQKPL